MNSELRFYISIFLRRFHYFALVTIVVSAAAIATSILLPTKYYSDALLLVESPQIPEELAATTVQSNPAEMLEVIEQRLLTRTNLLEIASQFNVFEDRASMFPDDVVEEMRRATTTRISTGPDRASLFMIGFEAEDSQTAALVVGDYVTRILESNVALRTGRAEGTLEFFEQEIERLSADLSRKSAEILQFKNANINALPENLDYTLARHDEIRDRLLEIDREIGGLGQQRERLILIFNATGGVGSNQQDLRSPKERELDQVREELTEALTIYSETNPRVKLLRGRMERLEAAVASETGSEPDEAGAAKPVTILDVQLAELDARVAQLKEEKVGLEAQFDILSEALAKIPGNSIALEALERDYVNIQTQYNQAVSRGSDAATGERIELLSKGERISVINPPVASREPSFPNRPLIAIGGIVGAVFLGICLVLLMEVLNRSIRRPTELTRSLGISPLATIPLIRTPGEIVMRRGIILGSIVMVTSVAVGAIFYTHTQIMPLDLLADRTLSKIGL